MSLLPVAFFKKLMHKTQAVRLPESESNHSRPERGRTMVEMLMALLILGMISVGGYSGVKYALGLSQAWRGQAQINQLAKDIISLYAWQDSYATLTMKGRRGICNTIISPGNQECVITSPWNQSVTVSTGKSNGSFKIVMHNTPKSICKHLSEMRFENVYMAQQECTSGSQDIEFVMDKNDRECSEGCPNGYSCVNGTCRAQDREDACNGVECVGECLTGECRGGTCLRKQNGTACSNGICVNGTCTEETQPPETTITTWETTTTTPIPTTTPHWTTTTPWETTTTTTPWETTTSLECPSDKPLRDKYGTCYACDTTGGVDVSGVTSNCNVCQNREVLYRGCILKECPTDRPLRGYLGDCFSCDETLLVNVQGVTENCDVCENRMLSGYLCKLR